MPFFIKNKTKCSICNKPINYIKESAQLPYVSIEKYPELGIFSRSYVHRSCWEKWQYAKDYATASFELIQEARANGNLDELIYCGNLIGVFYYPAIESFKIFDYQILLEIEFPFSIKLSSLYNLIHRVDLNNVNLEEFEFEEWRIFMRPDHAILQKNYAMEIIQELKMPKDRFLKWHEVLTFTLSWILKHKKNG